MPFYQLCLRSELARRCASNARYSLRAYARSLGVDAGTLSRLIAGKQLPTEKMARRLLARLDLAPQERARFLSTIGAQHGARNERKAKTVMGRFSQEIRPTELSLEVYRAIADWHHIAILELTFVEGFKSDPRWIARVLDISVTEAKLAVDRLIGLGLLSEQGGRLAKTSETLTSADKGITTPAHRKHQRQLLEKAIHSLENDPIELRNVTNTAMAVDPALLPEAKRRIQEFQLSLCEFLQGGRRTAVYNLEVCLYPLSKETKK
ncbi:MAG TPA: DUF4423 domain-containing protein [Bdellovibrionota bacterium]|nr:DUF4423 domain-containing protein [Bdellovibrionota bacterium]